MCAKSAEYALLQHKYQFENIRQAVGSFRERARETEHTCVRLIEICWSNSALMYSMVWRGCQYQHANTILNR